MRPPTSSEELILRTLERDIGPLFPPKTAAIPVPVPDERARQTLLLADVLEKEARLLTNPSSKEAGLSPGAIYRAYAHELGRTAPARAVKSLVSRFRPAESQAVKALHGKARVEAARTSVEAAKKGREALEALTPEDAKKMLLQGGKKELSPGQKSLLVGIGAGAPVAIGLAASRGSDGVRVYKTSSAPKTAALDVDELVCKLDGETWVPRAKEAAVRASAEDWIEAYTKVASALETEDRSFLRKEEVQELAYGLAKVAGDSGYPMDANELVACIQAPTLDGFHEAIEKVALVGTGAGRWWQLLSGRARGVQQFVAAKHQALQARRGAHQAMGAAVQNPTAGAVNKALQAGKAQQGARAGAAHAKWQARATPAGIVPGLVGAAHRAAKATGAGIQRLYRSVGGTTTATTRASTPSGGLARRTPARSRDELAPWAVPVGVGVGGYALGKSSSLDKDAVFRRLREFGKLWEEAGRKAGQSRARTSIQQIAGQHGLKFVEETEEAARKGLTAGQTGLLAGGAGVGGVLLGRNKDKGPNIRVTKL